MNQWISVKDKNDRPESKKPYLCSDGDSVIFGVYYDFDFCYDDYQSNGFLLERYQWNYEVTHWMPLPKPPAKSKGFSASCRKDHDVMDKVGI